MHIDILTIFPAMFTSSFSESIIRRAMDKRLVTIQTHDLRNWTNDKHKTVDDRPYGGGPGMVMMIEPIDKAIQELKNQKSKVKNISIKPKVILTSARGKLFNQQLAQRLSLEDRLIFIAGHYEGVDQRVEDHLVDESLSIGNYVLTGGELPVMVMVDAIVRLLHGVVGKSQSLTEESHNQPGYIEYPQYTRPENYRGWQVPGILLSGNHKEIKEWQKNEEIIRIPEGNNI